VRLDRLVSLVALDLLVKKEAKEDRASLDYQELLASRVNKVLVVIQELEDLKALVVRWVLLALLDLKEQDSQVQLDNGDLKEMSDHLDQLVYLEFQEIRV